MTACINNNRITVCYTYAGDTSDKGSRLRTVPTAEVASNADRIGLAFNTSVANSDIVIPCNIGTCPGTQGDILAAGEVAREGVRTDGCVEAAGIVKNKRGRTDGCVEEGRGVLIERLNTVGRVPSAGYIDNERIETISRIAAAGRVAIERIKTDGRVQAAGCKTKQRIIALSGVAVG